MYESSSCNIDFARRVEDIRDKIHNRLGVFAKDSGHHPALNEFLNAADHILLSKDAKRLRCYLPVLIGDQCNMSEETCLNYGIVIELLHYTSLIHDDVIDKDHYRRNCKTLNNVFTNAQAVLIGDFMICEVIHYSLQFTHSSKVIELLCEATKNLVTGLIIEQRLMPKEPTIKRYREMAALKTGSLFKLSFGLPFVGGAHLSTALQCGELFGILFQIYDDYLDSNDDIACQNIFGILTAEEIIAFWQDQFDLFMELCRSLKIERMALNVLYHLRTKGYFLEVSTPHGTLFHLPRQDH